MFVGTIGKTIIFTVSSFAVLTFKDAKRDVKGRWTVHEVLGEKPRSEFLGPGLWDISITIHLDSQLGIMPQLVLEAIHEKIELGTADYFIVGLIPLCENPVCIKSASEALNQFYVGGVLTNCDVTLELEEYV